MKPTMKKTFQPHHWNVWNWKIWVWKVRRKSVISISRFVALQEISFFALIWSRSHQDVTSSKFPWAFFYPLSRVSHNIFYNFFQRKDNFLHAFLDLMYVLVIVSILMSLLNELACLTILRKISTLHALIRVLLA